MWSFSSFLPIKYYLFFQMCSNLHISSEKCLQLFSEDLWPNPPLHIAPLYKQYISMEKRGLPLIKCCLIYLLNYPLETKWRSLFFAAEFSRFNPLVPLQQSSAKWMFVRIRRSCWMKYNVSVTWNHSYYGSRVLNALDNWAWGVMGAGKRNLIC